MGETINAEQLKKLKAVQLSLLARFIAICEAENLRWFVMFGTMLGAVRHGGFIPWDDDIDVVMPRADYDRLAGMAALFAPPLFLQTPENDPAACTRFMRLKNSDTTFFPAGYPNGMTRGGNFGGGIDILPLDVFPSPKAAAAQGKAAKRYRTLRLKQAARDEMPVRHMPAWKRARCRMLLPRTYAGLTKRYHAACAKYQRAEHEMPYCAFPVRCSEKSGQVLQKEWFASAVPMPFEGLQVNVPTGYREIAGVLYKHGLGLPPEPERKNTHPGFIDAETPYKEHLKKYTCTFDGLSGKEVMLFGAGNVLRIYLARFGKAFPPVCAFDNDSAKWGQTVCGVPVRAPADIPGMLAENRRLIIASMYHNEIACQLRQIGITDFYVFMDGWNYDVQNTAN